MLDYATLFCIFNLSLTFRIAWFSKNHKNASNFARLHLERCHPLFTQEDNYETSLKNYLSCFCYKGFIMEHFAIYFPICLTLSSHCWIILNEDQVIVQLILIKSKWNSFRDRDFIYYNNKFLKITIILL